jgi:hypothetical protein
VLQNNTQLGFFFFKKEDAEAIIAKVRTCRKHFCSSLTLTKGTSSGTQQQ